MGHRFTREQVYEMVWTRPRNAIAKEFGVSDTAIRKLCDRGDIPAPSHGHWLRRDLGRPVPRPPLPIRLPGHARYLRLGESGSYQEIYWRERDCLFDVIEPEVFEEAVEDQVEVAVRRIGVIRHRRELDNPHPALARVLRDEAERRSLKDVPDGWHWKKPRFDSPIHQRQLKLFNSLAHALGEVFPRCSVQVDEEHQPGVGMRHDLRLWVTADSTWTMDLRILEPGVQRRGVRCKVSTTTLEIPVYTEGAEPLYWVDTVGNRLERQLESIVRGVLREAERRLRQAAVSNYERRREHRQAQLAEIARRHREAQERELAAQAALQKQRRDRILRLARESQQAQEVRALVEIVRGQFGRDPETLVLLEEWSKDALALADQLDPARRSIHDLIG